MKFKSIGTSGSLLPSILISSIFVGELLVMVLIDHLPSLSALEEALIDSSLLSLITYPVIYLFAFNPLKSHIQTLEKKDEELVLLNIELKHHQNVLEENNFKLRTANLALKESHDRFDHLFNFSPAGCLIISDEGFILEANHTSKKLLKSEAHNIIGENVITFLADNELGHWASCLGNVLNHDTKYSCKLVMKSLDNTVFYALMTCIRENPLVSNNIYATFIDITQENWKSFR